MIYLNATSTDGVKNCGDPVPTLRSPFGVLADSIRLEAEHDATNDGEDPQSLQVRLDIANRIASERLSLYIEATGSTQGQVARQLGISRGYLNRCLNGKAALTYGAYEKLFEAETVFAILEWIANMKTPEEQARFVNLLNGIRVADSYAKTLYCLGATFGETAIQDWPDSMGSILPIPAEADAPEALSAAIRKAAV